MTGVNRATDLCKCRAFELLLVLLMIIFHLVGVDDTAAVLCGIPRITLHPILLLDPSLVLLPQVLLTANTGWAAPTPIGFPRGLTLLTINLATNTTQVDHMAESRHNMYKV